MRPRGENDTCPYCFIEVTLLQTINRTLIRQSGFTKEPLYQLIIVPGVSLPPCNRASVLSSDETHLLDIVIRAFPATPDSLEPPDHKPAGKREWPGRAAQPSCLGCFYLLGDLGMREMESQ